MGNYVPPQTSRIMLTDRPGVEVEEIVKTIVFAFEYCTVVQVTTSHMMGRAWCVDRLQTQCLYHSAASSRIKQLHTVISLMIHGAHHATFGYNKTSTCEQNPADPAPYSCTVSIKMTD